MKYGILIFACAVLSGCSNADTSPKLIPLVYETPETKTEIADKTVDTFQQRLDILFVIDDSGSMGTHQSNLAANAGVFADSIIRAKFLDYHVGVISSSMYSSFGSVGGGQLFGTPRYIDRTTIDGVGKLSRNMIVGTGGDVSEKFFDPLVLALSEPLLTGWNAGFYRHDSYIAIIFVTDTDDQSTREDARSTYDFLLSLKGNINKVFVGAAYIPDSEVLTCSGESWEINNANNLPEFFQLTNALTFSLCDPDFGQKLAEIGRVISKQAATMYLKKVPKQGTIKVSIGDVEVPQHYDTGWAYNPVLNAIEFGQNINWDLYSDNDYPKVDFEAIKFPPQAPAEPAE